MTIRSAGKLGAAVLYVLALWLWANQASAAAMTININSASNNELNPITIFTDVTDMVLIEIAGIADGGQYDAWSAWDANSGCVSQVPSMCAEGYN